MAPSTRDAGVSGGNYSSPMGLFCITSKLVDSNF